MRELTETQLQVLAVAIAHGRVATHKAVPTGVYRSLVKRGLLAPDHHGAYLITDDGRIAARKSPDLTPQMKLLAWAEEE